MDLALLFITVSVAYDLPPGLLSAVCYVESEHRPGIVVARDGDGTPSYGTCMIKEKTARFMGFKGLTKDLLRPEVNIKYAGQYLRYQLNRYDGNLARGVTAYNKGNSSSHGGSEYLAKVFNTFLTRGDARAGVPSRVREGWGVRPK